MEWKEPTYQMANIADVNAGPESTAEVPTSKYNHIIASGFLAGHAHSSTRIRNALRGLNTACPFGPGASVFLPGSIPLDTPGFLSGQSQFPLKQSPACRWAFRITTPSALDRTGKKRRAAIVSLIHAHTLRRSRNRGQIMVLGWRESRHRFVFLLDVKRRCPVSVSVSEHGTSPGTDQTHRLHTRTHTTPPLAVTAQRLCRLVCEGFTLSPRVPRRVRNRSKGHARALLRPWNVNSSPVSQSVPQGNTATSVHNKKHIA